MHLLSWKRLESTPIRKNRRTSYVEEKGGGGQAHLPLRGWGMGLVGKSEVEKPTCFSAFTKGRKEAGAGGAQALLGFTWLRGE